MLEQPDCLFGETWVDEQVTAHATAGRTWAWADAHDALFPREAIPPAGAVPVELRCATTPGQRQDY
ncbi:MAG: hypothetical protein ACT4NY_10380 [Pseudonocardiales bacterium]